MLEIILFCIFNIYKSTFEFKFKSNRVLFRQDFKIMVNCSGKWPLIRLDIDIKLKGDSSYHGSTLSIPLYLNNI